MLALDKGWNTNWVDTKWTQKLASWPADIPVHRVEAKAGACIVFSEKLKHGTIPWSGAGQRRTLFYKYVPYGMHHEDAGYDVLDPSLTANQKQLLEFPPVFCNTPEQQYDIADTLSVHAEWSPRGRMQIFDEADDNKVEQHVFRTVAASL